MRKKTNRIEINTSNNTVPITLTLSEEQYNLIEKIRKSSGDFFVQETIRGMINYYLTAHGHKIA